MWNKNVFLLWQGQLVSTLGDMVYSVALGFWVLRLTGSTSAMGVVIAAGFLPKALASPFTGVLVDRANRKLILVGMDFIRGVTVIIVAIGAFAGWLTVPFIIGASVIIGLCGAFFDPTRPEHNPQHQQARASGSDQFPVRHQPVGGGHTGNPIGGLLFTALGAPVLFLFNGISYLISSFTELFMDIPKVEQEAKDFRFFDDMKEGLAFIFAHQGMLVLMVSVFSLNFLLSLSGILFIPYFEQRLDLGPDSYGFAMSALSAASLAGFMLMLVRKIPKGKQYPFFAVSTTVFVIARLTLFSFDNYFLIIAQFVLFGFSVSIINSLIGAAGQLMVPAHLRGKVFGFLQAMGTGLMPLGMALGGILADFIPIPLIQLGTGVLVGIGFIPTLVNREFRRMINQDFTLAEMEPEPAASGDAAQQTGPT
jgi:DHA3 family macrolide efflux protein-like MFS transporter